MVCGHGQSVAGLVSSGAVISASEILDRARAPKPARSQPGWRPPEWVMLEGMCRNIRTLHNFEPPATRDEVEAAALQYVRKISGTRTPSVANREAFDHAVARVAEVTAELLDALVTNAPPKDREVEAAKARARSAERYRTA